MTTLAAVEYAFPPLYCPLPAAANPHAAAVEKRAEAWIAASGMCATGREQAWVLGSHSVNFYARFVPDADPDRLLATSLWVYWGFAFDDARCDAGPLSTRPADFARVAGTVQRALESPSAEDEGERFIPPLRDIAARLRDLGTPTQFQRFAAAHRAWLSGVLWQIGNRAAGRMPQLDEYLAMRLLSSGGEPTFAMLEIAAGREVPGRELDRPAVRALTEMAIAVAALDNDRHSLRRETAGRFADQNIYSVLVHQHALALPDAIEQAARIRDRILLRFLDLHGRIEARAGEELRGYLRGLCHGIRGNAEWGLRVPRYLSRGELPGGMDDSTLDWADAPLDDRSGPLPAPTVAWWWDENLC